MLLFIIHHLFLINKHTFLSNAGYANSADQQTTPKGLTAINVVLLGHSLVAMKVVSVVALEVVSMEALEMDMEVVLDIGDISADLGDSIHFDAQGDSSNAQEIGFVDRVKRIILHLEVHAVSARMLKMGVHE